MLQTRPDRRSFLTTLGLGSLVPALGSSCASLPDPADDAGAARDLFTADYLSNPA